MRKSRATLERIFDTIIKYLLKYNIECILFYGTLLGYLRDGNFIEGDDDIDFIMSRSQLPLLLKVVSENPDVLRYGIKNNDIVQVYVKYEGPVDFYLYDLIRTDDEEYILIRWIGNLLFEKKDVFPLKNIEFRGVTVGIPNNAEKITEEVYGKNWMTPIDKWKYNWDHINTVKKLKSTYTVIS